MATLSMMPSPHLSSASRSHPHTPLNLSPCPSPQLRAKGSSATLKPSSAGIGIGGGSTGGTVNSGAGTTSNITPATSPRSYARAPERRPYAPLLSSRASMSGAAGAKIELEGDTKMFVELVAQLVVARTKHNDAKRGRRVSGDEDEQAGSAEVQAKARPVTSSKARGTSPGAGTSLSNSGSWDAGRAELLVDVPVWSPGCFQDLSTLHSLRDRTLAQVHALLAHLITSHSIPASYHLLARSALATPSSSPASHRSSALTPLWSLPSLPPSSSPNSTSSPYTAYATPTMPGAHSAKTRRHPGWGCIRLAPSVVSPLIGMGKLELRPKVRRSSMDFSQSRPVPSRSGRTGSGHAGYSPEARAKTSPSSPTDSKGVLSASISAAELTPAPTPVSFLSGNGGRAAALGLETIPARQPLGAGACASDVHVPTEPEVQARDEKTTQKGAAVNDHDDFPGETVLLETDDAVLVEKSPAVHGGASDDEDEGVHLKSGYTSGTVSDDEEEDADEVVMREIEKRGAKEGTIFLMTLFGSPALILV